jgi:hypothetical protein
MKIKFISFLALFIFINVAYAKDAAAPFKDEQICKAAISANVSTKPNKMKSTPIKGGIHKISYLRDDGKKYTYNCKLEENEVRWKDSTMSDWNKNVKIYYKVSNNELHIKSDMLGTIFEKTFKASDF